MDKKHVIAVTNRQLTDGDPMEVIQRIASAGPRALILREKDLPDAEYTAMARRALEICRASEVQLFVHSRLQTAREIGCRALHLSIPLLRQIAGEKGIQLQMLFDAVSVSCHTIGEVREAVGAGAAQIVLGNIFETDCKKGKPGTGLEFLREAAEAAAPVPVYGIGGITPENLDAVLQTGAAGGCMMSWWYR